MSVDSFLMQVFISIALILGDGLYNFIKLLISTIAGFISMVQQNPKGMLPISDHGSSPLQKLYPSMKKNIPSYS
jgi:hypothetical protein